MRNFQRICGWAVPCTFLVMAIGCGGDSRGSISGRVTLNGAPVEKGTIQFILAGDPHKGFARGEITAGNYSIAGKQGPGVGLNRVEISWGRKTGKMRPAVAPFAATEEIVEAIPLRYNRQSELQMDIKPGKNNMNFDLKSK